MQHGRLGPAIDGRDADQDIVGRGFGVFHEHIEVAVLGEDAGIDQLIFRIVARAAPVLVDQLLVRKFGLRVLVERTSCRSGWACCRGRSIDLLDIFAVIALGAGEAEEALLEEGIAAIP